MAFQGGQSVHNRTELNQRPVRAASRIAFGQDLQKRLPRSIYLEKLLAIEEDVLEPGSRDEAPTPQVLKNIHIMKNAKDMC